MKGVPTLFSSTLHVLPSTARWDPHTLPYKILPESQGCQYRNFLSSSMDRALPWDYGLHPFFQFCFIVIFGDVQGLILSSALRKNSWWAVWATWEAGNHTQVDHLQSKHPTAKWSFQTPFQLLFLIKELFFTK